MPIMTFVLNLVYVLPADYALHSSVMCVYVSTGFIHNGSHEFIQPIDTSEEFLKRIAKLMIEKFKATSDVKNTYV